MNDTIGDVFNSTFIELLQALLETRWKTNHLGTNHTITINGYSIDDYQVEDYLSNIKLMCDKHLIRTFIVQCLNNSLIIQVAMDIVDVMKLKMPKLQ